MKGLLSTWISLFGAIAVITPAIAQPTDVTPGTGISQPSQLLLTEPATLQKVGTTSPTTANPQLDIDKLTDVANSIRAKPKSPNENSVIPNDLVPRELIRTPSRRQSDIDPLGPFQVPGPTPSFGINLNNF